MSRENSTDPTYPYHVEKWTTVFNLGKIHDLFAVMGSNGIPFGFGSEKAMDEVCLSWNEKMGAPSAGK